MLFNPTSFGLVDIAEILYQWTAQLYDMWTWITTTSALEMLNSIVVALAGSVVGIPAGIVVDVYIIIMNFFAPGYLVEASVLEFMLGGMLRAFIFITVILWLAKLVQAFLPDIIS